MVTVLSQAFTLPPMVYLIAVVPAAYVGRLWAGLAAAGWSWAAARSLLGADGESLAQAPYDWALLLLFVGVAVLIAVEEAARSRAGVVQKRLGFLAELNRTLTTSLDDQATVADLARWAVPRLADWCAIHLWTEDEGELTRFVVHQDPEKLQLVERFQEHYPHDLTPPLSPLAEVLATGHSLVFSRLSDESIRQIAGDEEDLDRLRSLGLRSAITVPVISTLRVLGGLTVGSAQSHRRYTKADVAFMEELGRTAGLAIENARLHQSQSRIAQTLQSSLLTTDIPEIPGVEVVVRYRPASEGALVGGDFYDVFEAKEGSWAVAVGDVSGKGPEAAAVTGLVRYTIRAASVRESKPSAVLEAVNRQILRQNVARFCTAAVARVERTDGRLGVLVSCGGHPPPLVYRRGQAVETLESTGTLLGALPDPKLVDVRIELEPGDAIVFYTDGVIERFERAGRGGDAQLVALLWESEGAGAERIADRIYDEAASVEGEKPRDDMALVILRVRPGPE